MSLRFLVAELRKCPGCDRNVAEPHKLTVNGRTVEFGMCRECALDLRRSIEPHGRLVDVVPESKEDVRL